MVVTRHGGLGIGDECAVSFVAMAIATVAASLGGAINARAAEPPPFRMQQVTAGEVVYDRNCARCHGPTLNGGQFGPALTGDNFSAHWRGKNLANYFAKVETMPFGRPASLDRASYTNAVAFILYSNGASPGTVALTSDTSAMKSFTIPGLLARATSPRAAAAENQPPSQSTNVPSEQERLNQASLIQRSETISPQAVARLSALSFVTDHMLGTPSADDWLIWRRTYDSQGYSPLEQINARTVKSMRQVWSWALAPGWMEGTPLVHDGVLFIQSGADTFQALDGASGDLLWSYVRLAPEEANKASSGLSTVKRNMAIYGTTLYAATVDAHIIALDVKAGHPLWDKPIADYKQSWYVSSGPLVVRGKVITGVAGTVAKQPGGAFIVALDAGTGKELWRFNTVARPGEPGGDSWNTFPVDKRSGGSIWTAGSYDPDLNLVFFGTGNTYDIESYRRKATPEANVDLLYTNSTLALDPDTGKLVWYFQHMPNDLLDLDWAFEQTIMTISSGGVPRKVIMTGGKIALFDAVDAKTGRYLFSRDFGLQTVVTAVDKTTGAKTINPGTIPTEGQPQLVCPSALGARTWESTSFDPETRILYAPLDEICTTNVRDLIAAMIARPDSEGKLGNLAAMDVETGKILWSERVRPIQTSALLATAGGVVFNSNVDRWFRANDSKTGAELWRTRLQDTPNAFPITYMVKGKQYVAVAAGGSKTAMALKMGLMPEIQLPGETEPVLWVFALED
jgi:PQQ-dependent dehydrogenase (methanol/ethanol family)